MTVYILSRTSLEMHLENKNTHDRGESCHTQGEAVVDAWDEILEEIPTTYRKKYLQHTGCPKKQVSGTMVNECRLKTNAALVKMW